MFATAGNHLASIEALTEGGADATLTNDKAFSALLIAEESGSDEVKAFFRERTAASAGEGEAKLGLTRGQRREVQQALTALGFNAGGADGIFGPRTRAAIKDYQTANKHLPTGYRVSGWDAAWGADGRGCAGAGGVSADGK